METFQISPKGVTRFLVSIVIILTVASFCANFAQYVLGTTLKGLVLPLNVDRDSSLPTWYSSISLLICSFLLLLISLTARKNKQSHVVHWFILSLLFLYISVDEVATFRESFFATLRSVIRTDGLFYFRWTIFAIPFVILFLLSYLKFLAHLPKQIRNLFVLSGAVFVLGAIGMEMLAGLTKSLYGDKNMLYVTVTAIEEFCEMFGVVIFIHTLLLYLQMQGIKEVRLCLSRKY